MNEYETIYIGQPDLPAGRIEKINEKIQKILKGGKADMIDCRDWGTRKLAYRIGKWSNGHYIYFNYAGNGHFIVELERTLKYEEGVIRCLTVRVADIDMIAKRKKRINQLEEGHPGPDDTNERSGPLSEDRRHEVRANGGYGGASGKAPDLIGEENGEKD